MVKQFARVVQKALTLHIDGKMDDRALCARLVVLENSEPLIPISVVFVEWSFVRHSVLAIKLRIWSNGIVRDQNSISSGNV